MNIYRGCQVGPWNFVTHAQEYKSIIQTENKFVRWLPHKRSTLCNLDVGIHMLATHTKINWKSCAIFMDNQPENLCTSTRVHTSMSCGMCMSYDKLDDSSYIATICRPSDTIFRCYGCKCCSDYHCGICDGLNDCIMLLQKELDLIETLLNRYKVRWVWREEDNVHQHYEWGPPHRLSGGRNNYQVSQRYLGLYHWMASGVEAEMTAQVCRIHLHQQSLQLCSNLKR